VDSTKVPYPGNVAVPGVRIADRWTAANLRRALNAVLPRDVWVAAAFEMREAFHARYSAASRRYSYLIGTDDEANTPFRRRFELSYTKPLERSARMPHISRLGNSRS
jgi:tRNA pseudouridine38-40 synthase